ncbi:MAG: preprotein translocase subunit SecG [Bacteroidetes bacterium]|nr:preprotein translocase subunit SecG [Bacteroidota bacterium]
MQILLVAQIIVGVLLTLAILIQVKGTGFGRGWGSLSTHSSRRGIEGVVFKLTFALSFLFILGATLSLFI